MVSAYAILDSNGRCINRILWDGQSSWQPPKDCTVVEDSNNLYPIISATEEATAIAESGVTPDANQL